MWSGPGDRADAVPGVTQLRAAASAGCAPASVRSLIVECLPRDPEPCGGLRTCKVRRRRRYPTGAKAGVRPMKGQCIALPRNDLSLMSRRVRGCRQWLYGLT